MIEDYTKYKYKKTNFSEDQRRNIKKLFKNYAKKLNNGGGVQIGNLDRVLIPKSDLNVKHLTKGLGFLPTRIAVPESGQTQFRTFRHPHNKYHIHSHRKYWTMHRDKHSSFTSLRRKTQLIKNPELKNNEISLKKKTNKISKPTNAAIDFLRGTPHNIKEGIPGWYSYLKNKYITKGKNSTVARIKKGVPTKMKYFETLISVKV